MIFIRDPTITDQVKQNYVHDENNQKINCIFSHMNTIMEQHLTELIIKQHQLLFKNYKKMTLEIDFAFCYKEIF